MKLSVVLALFIIFQLGAASLMRNWMFDFEKELEHDYDDSEIGFHNIHSLMARSRRGDKVKICGTKVLKMVMVMCGGECSCKLYLLQT